MQLNPARPPVTNLRPPFANASSRGTAMRNDQLSPYSSKMRLLHTETYEIHDFVVEVPHYAILSHTWSDDEVTFQDLQDFTICTAKSGWRKIAKCCERARQDGWGFVWIDSCCIDKTNSTELSESINSMFKWYEEAQVCYAYLEDVPSRYRASRRDLEDFYFDSIFPKSRWFTRGWTLQELLAPAFLIFLDQSWIEIGPREEMAIGIQKATGISVEDLSSFNNCSIATKLSWAAYRQTRKVEDQAYCLLGLLGVSMPLMYGEGQRAFVRLQYELIRNYNDESILAWSHGPSGARIRWQQDLGGLAYSPNHFKWSNGVTIERFDRARREFSLTNTGIEINAELWEANMGYGPIYAIKLNCKASSTSTDNDPVALVLRMVDHEFNLLQRYNETLVSWSNIQTLSRGIKSLGRRRIVIRKSEEGTRRAPRLKMGFSLRFHHPIALQTFKVLQYNLVTKEIRPCRHSSTTDSAEIFEGMSEEKDSLIVAMEVREAAGVDSDAFRMILTRHHKTPKIGIWDNRIPIERTDVEEVMERMKMLPRPTTVACSGGGTLAIQLKPTPDRLLSRSDKAFMIEISHTY